MRDGMRAELNSLCMKFANFPPRQVIRPLDASRRISNTIARQKHRRPKTTLFQEWKRICIEILIAVVEGQYKRLGPVSLGIKSGDHLGKTDTAVPVTTKPLHLLGKDPRRCDDLIVSMHSSEQ